MRTTQSVRSQRMPAEPRPHDHRNRPDFSLYGSGTVYLFGPLSDTAQAWLDAHCPPGADHQYLGQKLAIEFRCIEDIIHLAIRDGLAPAATASAERSVN